MTAALRQLVDEWRVRGKQLADAADELNAALPTLLVGPQIVIGQGVSRDEVDAAIRNANSQTARTVHRSSEQTSALPAFGDAWQGGSYAGITTSKTGEVYALVLLDDKPTGELNWKDALAWAKALNAEVPTRVESAMLFANLPDAFEKDWHWTSEQHSDADYAWVQGFDYGYQSPNRKSYEGRVRAVRRLPLNPSTIEVQL
jgi:hypothetical protein